MKQYQGSWNSTSHIIIGALDHGWLGTIAHMNYILLQSGLMIAWSIFPKSSLTWKCHFDQIIITGYTKSCQNHNFGCSQWWNFVKMNIFQFQCWQPTDDPQFTLTNLVTHGLGMNHNHTWLTKPDKYRRLKKQRPSSQKMTVGPVPHTVSSE